MTKKHPRVLIVDDEYYLGQMLAQALIVEQIEAIAVTDVDSAIDWLKKKKIDLVISDIYLPNKNGVDLFNFAKENQVETPFIFMTGNPDLQMAVDFLTQGGYDYIVKPFMVQDFIQKIKSVLASHQIRKQEKDLVNDLRSMLATRMSELRIFHDIFESTEDGVVITDVDGNIVRVNNGFEKITGMENIQLVQQHLDILQQHLMANLEVKQILNKLKNGKTWQGEATGYRGEDEKWQASITFSPIYNEDSHIFAYAGLFKDVTVQRQVEQALISSLQKMNMAQEAIIFGLAQLAEHRDQTTGHHLERIRIYCKLLSEALFQRKLFPDAINEEFIQMIYRTAPLHDIGKVGIPDYVLLKDGSLNNEEYEMIKSHTMIGFHTLNAILDQYGDMQFLKMGIEITAYHHEKWNGSGYPEGRAGNDIPLSARILAIADVYDALTTERSYKEPFSHEKTVEIMKKDRGKHFDPEVFSVFLEISDEFDKIRQGWGKEATGQEKPGVVME